MSSTETFRRARDFLVAHREDYETAYRDFRWPVLDRFNWALDWFDVIADGNAAHRAAHRRGGRRRGAALVRGAGRAVEPGRHLLPPPRRRARRPPPDDAAELRADLGGDARGDEARRRAWCPATVAAHAGGPGRPDRARPRAPRRHRRGRRREAARPSTASFTRHVVGEPVPGWSPSSTPTTSRRLHPARRDARDRSAAALLHVRHDREAEAGGPHAPQLPGGPPLDDVLDRPARGRRAHEHPLARLGQARLVAASSRRSTRARRCSCYNYARFDARARRSRCWRAHGVTTLCAPPTVWRMLILEDLAAHPVKLREASAPASRSTPR